jgi:hypothetical protein
MDLIRRQANEEDTMTDQERQLNRFKTFTYAILVTIGTFVALSAIFLGRAIAEDNTLEAVVIGAVAVVLLRVFKDILWSL